MDTAIPSFSVNPLSDALKEKLDSIWKERCPVPLKRLSLVTFSFYDFEDNEHQGGELVVLDSVAKRVMSIFERLHGVKFPIAQALSINAFESPEAAMDGNNTSAFRFRDIRSHPDSSIHAYETAIDINPTQNPLLIIKDLVHPYKATVEVYPAEGSYFLNRSIMSRGMAEEVVGVFKENGFTIWGGDWIHPIDWKHFQTPLVVAKLMAAVPPEDAERLFEVFIHDPSLFDTA